jgi:hypothetical protein
MSLLGLDVATESVRQGDGEYPEFTGSRVPGLDGSRSN